MLCECACHALQVEWDGVKYPTDPSERAKASPPPHNHKGHKAVKSLHARHHKHHIHAHHEEEYHDHPHADGSGSGIGRTEYIRNGVDDDGVVTINGQRVASRAGDADAAGNPPPPSPGEDEAAAAAAKKARAKRAGPNIPNSNVAHGVHSILKAQGKSVKFAGDGDHHIDDVLKHGAVKVGGSRASVKVNAGGGVDESEVVPEAYRHHVEL